MLRTSILLAIAASASAFAPAALPTLARRATASAAPRMQLFEDGKLQGKGVVAIPPLGRPNTPAFDGTWAGDTGFDPLSISGWLDIRWLRESELKHCRLAMLATAGAVAQDIFQFPGTVQTFGPDKLSKLHDAAVKKGALGQILFWVSLTEIFSTAAILQWYTADSTRAPGYYGFDPLGLGQVRQWCNDRRSMGMLIQEMCVQGKDKAKLELNELKNGRLAMIAIGGIMHHYFITGKGPIELLTKP